MRYTSYRPQGYEGKADAKLPVVVKNLRRRLSEAQRSFAHDTLRLEREGLEELAGILVDFALDVHHRLGMWQSYESYNLEWFRTPLPMTVDRGVLLLDGIQLDRIRHLLWIVYPQLKPDLFITPSHQDLERVARVALSSLNERIPALPEDLGLEAFLATPNDRGWDVKKKLVWLGTRSYLFRLPFAHYLAEKLSGGRDTPEIEHVDDFVCMQCTRWSGLGAIDILAGTLDLSDERRRELRSWYERHRSAYQILSADKQGLEALNVVNDERYYVRMDVDRQIFGKGQLIYGSLVPWDGEWYWSGTQRRFNRSSPETIEEFKEDIVRTASKVVCRYWRQYEQRVRERMKAIHADCLAYYGRDLITYPDGLTMAADWQKEMAQHLASKPAEHVEEALARQAITDGKPKMPIPPELLDCTDGVAVFLNPDEGKEIMQGFDFIESGLRRRGRNLTEDEEQAIRGFVQAEETCPAFVRTAAAEHGADSISQAYLLRDVDSDFALDYLLRCYKGHFYRKRYPAISLV